MFKYFKVILLFICSSVYSFAADRPCFGVEFFPHEGSNLGILNGFYNLAASLVLPPLPVLPGAGIGQYELVSLGGGRQILGIGLPLTLQEKTDMALNRRSVGVRINFNARNTMLLNFVAAGMPLNAQQIASLDRAFQSGGYDTPLAAFLYRFTRFPPRIILPLNNNGVVIHVHLRNRVSKDMKEVHNNSLLNVHPAYTTIEDIINQQYPLVNSMTVVSYERTATY